MTTRSQKRKAVEQLVSIDQETPLSGNDQNENPRAREQVNHRKSKLRN